MPYLTENRYLYLETPLGENDLLLQGLTGHEALSQLFRFRLSLLAETTTSIKFEDLIGQKVSFGIGASGIMKPRHMHGIVVEFSQGARGTDFTEYQMSVAPEIWKLTRNFQSRIFQHVSIPEILKKVFQGYSVAYQLQGNFEPREYCTQYQESDFAFASRLMEEEGIYYFFKFSKGAHQLVIANTPQSHPDIDDDATVIYDDGEGGLREEQRIDHWEKSQSWGPGTYTAWDHHFQLPHRRLDADRKVIDSVQVGTVQHQLKVGNNEQMEVYENPGRYAQRFDGIDKMGGEKTADLQKIFTDNKRTAGVRIEQSETPRLLIHAASNHWQLIPGHRFVLQEHFDGDGPYVIVDVSHNASEGSFRSDEGGGEHYANTFTCLPSALPFRPPRSTGHPSVGGPVSAVVVGPEGEEIFTDKYGRVKVQFHWDRDGKHDPDSSCWIRTTTPWAGKHWGMVQIPRIGQEVIVDFICGDPDRPIIMGSVYNSDQMPPYTLPAHKDMMGFKSHSTIGGGGYNEFVIRDTKGKELIRTHAQKDTFTTVLHDQREIVHHDKNLHVVHDMQSQVNGDLSVTVNGKVAHHFDVDHSEVVIAERYLKAKRIIIEADQEICIKVGGNNVQISAAGVYVDGTMIDLNCGHPALNTTLASLKPKTPADP